MAFQFLNQRLAAGATDVPVCFEGVVMAFMVFNHTNLLLHQIV